MVNNLNLDLFSSHQIIFSTLWKIVNMIKNYQWGNPEKFISDLFQFYSLNIEAQQVEILSKGAFLLPCTFVFTRYSWKIHNKRWLKREEKTSRNIFPERVSTHSTVCIAEAWNQVLQYNEWMMPSYVAHFTPKAAATLYIYFRTVTS